MAKIIMNSVDPVLTDQEFSELSIAEKKPIVYDEDSPKLSAEQLKQFIRFDSIPLRISEDNIKRVISFGDKKIGILDRLLNIALKDDELVNRCIH